jgi:hypothetical protein
LLLTLRQMVCALLKVVQGKLLLVVVALFAGTGCDDKDMHVVGMVGIYWVGMAGGSTNRCSCVLTASIRSCAIA